jgi:ornithine carbamoyltransferase
MQKDFVSIADLTVEEIDELFEISKRLKQESRSGKDHYLLENKTLAMIFEKPSLRTRVTFETGMAQLGGRAIYLGPHDIQIGKRESVSDVAKNLSRWIDCIMARTFAHRTIVELASYASVPVINALSDKEHPCQILADFLTVLEHKEALRGLTYVYIGDSNNVCNSIILFAAIYGLTLRVCSPKKYEPSHDIVEQSHSIKNDGFQLEVMNNPEEAVKDADVLYTDVWASMGQEDEKETRARIFADFQVNQELVSLAKSDVIVLHCLPAHRGEEITDEILDGPHSVVLDEAENRLHTEKAVLVKLLTRS